jgi:hypothetical protein
MRGSNVTISGAAISVAPEMADDAGDYIQVLEVPFHARLVTITAASERLCHPPTWIGRRIVGRATHSVGLATTKESLVKPTIRLSLKAVDIFSLFWESTSSPVCC